MGTKFHTYFIENTENRLVIRGLPIGADVMDIKEELEHLNIGVIEVQAMHTHRGPRKPLPLYLVKIPTRTGENLLTKVSRVLQATVRIENQRYRTSSVQSNLCQAYRHTQNATTTDNEDGKGACKCANCGEEHPASYQGCRRKPRSFTADRRTNQENRSRRNLRNRSKRITNRSYPNR